MLGKLIKHEFRATGRLMAPLFGALLLLAVFARAADLYTLFGAPGTCCCAGMEQKYRIFRKKK